MNKPKSSVAPHVFLLDPDVPADPLDQRVPPARACRECRLLGRPGDAHHAMPAAEPDAQSRAAGDN
jgi:hypothetical protein